MNRLSVMLLGMMWIATTAPVQGNDTIGAYSVTNLGSGLETANSLITTTGNNEQVTIHFFYTLPTDWSGQGASSGISYYEYQVYCPGFSSATYHDPGANLIGTYDGTVLNITFSPGTTTPLIPDAGNGGHIYLGYMSAFVATTSTTINVSIRPYPGSVFFDGNPLNIGPGIKNGANDTLLLTCYTSSGGDPTAGTPDWTKPALVVNGAAPVGNEFRTWSGVKALYK